MKGRNGEVVNEKSKVDPSDAVHSVDSATVASYCYFVTVTLWEWNLEWIGVMQHIYIVKHELR